eukprot:scaffold381065_cov24-Prasinocladus_malaysianus.AAC.1
MDSTAINAQLGMSSHQIGSPSALDSRRHKRNHITKQIDFALLQSLHVLEALGWHFCPGFGLAWATQPSGLRSVRSTSVSPCDG